MTDHLGGRDTGAETVRLTPRQLQVVRLTVLGYANRQIAAILEIADDTVTVFLSQVFQKLGLTSRRELLDFVMTGHLDLIEHGATKRNHRPHPEGCGCDSVYCSAMRLARIN